MGCLHLEYSDRYTAAMRMAFDVRRRYRTGDNMPRIVYIHTGDFPECILQNRWRPTGNIPILYPNSIPYRQNRGNHAHQVNPIEPGGIAQA